MHEPLHITFPVSEPVASTSLISAADASTASQLPETKPSQKYSMSPCANANTWKTDQILAATEVTVFWILSWMMWKYKHAQVSNVRPACPELLSVWSDFTACLGLLKVWWDFSRQAGESVGVANHQSSQDSWTRIWTLPRCAVPRPEVCG